jgi:hypothetical protein
MFILSYLSGPRTIGARTPESFEAMMEGVYDVVCELCGGERVVEDSEDAEDRRIRMMESGIWPYGPY